MKMSIPSNAVVSAHGKHAEQKPIAPDLFGCRTGNSVNQSIVYGYIRVSTRDQNEARQVDAMKEFAKPVDPAKRIKRALKQWMFQIGLRKHP